MFGIAAFLTGSVCLLIFEDYCMQPIYDMLYI